MKVDGKPMRTIWLEPDGFSVSAIDQRRLPHEFVVVVEIPNAEAAAEAIRTMLVRGAPLIGATAAYGMALAMRDDRSDTNLDRAYGLLVKSRPTAINLKWALDEMIRVLQPLPPSSRSSGRRRTRYAAAWRPRPRAKRRCARLPPHVPSRNRTRVRLRSTSRRARVATAAGLPTIGRRRRLRSRPSGRSERSSA